MENEHWTDGLVMENETDDDFELVECEWCKGTGVVEYDEYSKEGQLIGVRTLSKACICKP
jgi:hypothetical protein